MTSEPEQSISMSNYRSLPLLLPAVEDGIFNDSWRIRQSSVELLGDLLFKVCHKELLQVLYHSESRMLYV